MSKLHSVKILLIAAMFSVVMAVPSRAQTLTTIHNFDGTDGQAPRAPVQGINAVSLWNDRNWRNWLSPGLIAAWFTQSHRVDSLARVQVLLANELCRWHAAE